MGINEFNLKDKNGLLFKLQNLKELKKSDLEDNAALINIFNIFNTNGDEKLDKEELNSLFNTMAEAANSKGNASIFDTEEAEMYVNTNSSKDGKTLKDIGVKAQDLFDFLGNLVKQAGNTYTAEDINKQA